MINETSLLEAQVGETKITSMQDLFDHMVSFARNTYRPDGIILPMWTVMDKDGNATVFLSPLGEPAQKDAVAESIKAAAKRVDATMIGFMSETWLAPDNKDGVAPVDHPERREAIYFTVETASGKSMSGNIIINRINEETATLGALEVHPSSTTYTGRFAHMFPEQTLN